MTTVVADVMFNPLVAFVLFECRRYVRMVADFLLIAADVPFPVRGHCARDLPAFDGV